MTDPKHDINTHEEYLADLAQNEKWEDLLKTTIQTRNFEIELYWKRTTYYWTINAAILAGYFLLLANPKGDAALNILVVSSLGVVFSLAWHLTNKGSKFWQVNWEKHLALLEDKVHGPLFKTTIRYKNYSSAYRLLVPTEPFPFSVSKINALLSAFVFGLWSLMWIKHIWYSYSISWSPLLAPTAMCILTVTFVFAFLLMGQTGRKFWPLGNRHDKTRVNFQRQGIEESGLD